MSVSSSAAERATSVCVPVGAAIVGTAAVLLLNALLIAQTLGVAIPFLPAAP